MVKRSDILIIDKEISFIKTPGEVFGDHYELSEQKHKRSFLLCKTPVKCLELTQSDLGHFLDIMYNSQEYQEKMQFIVKSIPFL